MGSTLAARRLYAMGWSDHGRFRRPEDVYRVFCVGVGSIYALTGVIFGKVRRMENISLGLVYNGFGTQTHLSLLLKKIILESCNESPSPAVFSSTENLLVTTGTLT